MVYFLDHASRRRIEFPVCVNIEGQNNPRMTRFIDVPIESCGMASPLRVTLQAGAPDILLILLRYDNSYNVEKVTEAEVARLTPKKFTNEHTSASLSAAGLLVCIKPRYTASGVSNVVKILNLGTNDATRKLFHAYPGPLVRGITHKKTVIEFCEDQIRLGPPSDTLRSRGNSMSSLCSQQSANRASFTLLWNLLILLLRQNGMVVGTDISELLMKNKSEFPYDLDGTASATKTASGRNSVQSDAKKSREVSDAEVDESGDEPESRSKSSEERQSLTEEDVTDKFRNYLLYGNVNEALDWATDNNLWGHALFLASKVDRRSHANVMMKFANKLPLCDPLQTLYQLMSLRTPSSVTSAVDEKWGDWRPHLAMIISNTSQKPELNIKAITTLGDSLYNRGDVFGAHFCYLMAQVNFGKYRNVNQDSSQMSNTSTSPRLILLGSSPHRPFKQFATSEAIMMTEIYEYACTLNDEKFSVTEFQPFKYILASRMLDYGLQLKALLYMEQISKHIQQDPSKYEADFIERVFVMADRLKYYDPMHEKLLDDTSPDAQEVLSYHSTSVPNLSQDPQASSTGYAQQQGIDYTKSDIDEQFREINQQFNQLNLQYQTDQQMQQQQQQQNQPVSLDYTAPAMNPSDYQSQQLGDSYQNHYHSMPYGGAVDQGNPVQSMDSPNYYDPAQFGNAASLGQQQNMSENSSNFDYYGQSQTNTEPLPPASQTPSSVEDKCGEEDVTEIMELQESPKRLERQPVEDMPKPQITMPNSFSNKPGFYEDTPQEGGERKQNDGTGSKGQANESAAKKGKEAAKGTAQHNNQSSGWFGGIWGKFSLKPKNQMILPDDKNPTIVWDPDKKKWVNTDGEADEAESFKPPPKMADFAAPQSNHEYSVPHPENLPQQIPQPTPQSTPAPAVVAAPLPSTDGAPVPKGNNLQSNMFKMQRNRTLKNSYVDVFNPSGAPMKPAQPVMAPTLPSVPQTGFFVPPTGSGANLSSEQADNTPQFYNPNQFAWKETRSQWGPAFSSGKMKAMFPILENTCKKMSNFLRQEVASNPKDGVHFRDVSARFTTEVVTDTIFGIEAGTFAEENAPLCELGSKLLDCFENVLNFFILSAILPLLRNLRCFWIVSRSVGSSFEELMKKGIQFRSQSNYQRSDFLSFIMDLGSKKNLSVTEMTSHGLTVYLDGYETTSIAIPLVLYELGRNIEAQEKLRREIQEYQEKDGINYESIQEMQYLDQVVNETMRIHPPLIIISKLCTESVKYPVNGRDVEIPRGMTVHIPIFSIHRNENNFPNPEEFIPERFNEENGGSKIFKDKCSFLPFGNGPRICLGMRFALLQVKTAVVEVIKQYKVTVNEKTKQPLDLDVGQFFSYPRHGIYLNLKPV
uniref:Protein transport protein sec16 n=1 Tax=Lutzomyia longipalpis TaxID=7200 RepID=A0A1B0CTM0_LUTLO